MWCAASMCTAMDQCQGLVKRTFETYSQVKEMLFTICVTREVVEVPPSPKKEAEKEVLTLHVP